MSQFKQHISEQKLLLRKRLRTVRNHAAQNHASTANQFLASQLKQFKPYLKAQKVATYLPINSEFPTSAIIEDNDSSNKKIYIPRISADEDHTMQFCYLQLDDQGKIVTNLSKNRYNIPEPESSAIKSTIPATELDIIFMPLLGFSLKGDRLGMGGGYYDRILSFKNTNTPPIKPYLVGLAYETQLTNELNAEPWDVQLDAVITERQSYHFNRALL